MPDGQKQPGQGQPAKNEVTLERDGIIHLYYRGPQTAEGIKALGEESDTIAEAMQERGEPVAILVDVGELGSFGQPEIQAWRRLMATRSFERMAIVHLNPALQVVLHFLVKMSNRKEKVEAFDDEAKAIDWLQEVLTNR